MLLASMPQDAPPLAFNAYLLAALLAVALAISPTSVGDDYSQSFDDFTVHFSVFSSTAISPEIAERHNLVRAKDRVYVNISVVPNSMAMGGVAVDVSGSAKNLIQQQKKLRFQEIAEPDGVYYLAPLRHSNREVFHFTIHVDPPGDSGPHQVTFTKTLYVNP